MRRRMIASKVSQSFDNRSGVRFPGMRIILLDDDVATIDVPQCVGPRILKDGLVGWHCSSPEAPEDVSSIKRLNGWIGDLGPTFVREKDGKMVVAKSERPVPTFEVAVNQRMSSEVARVFRSTDGRIRDCLGIVEGVLLRQMGVEHEPAPLPEVDRAGRASIDMFVSLFGTSSASLASRILGVRNEALARCEKIIELYVTRPSFLLCGTVDHVDPGIVAYAEYGVVGVGRRRGRKSR